MEAMGMKSCFFPADLENEIGGCIIEGKGYEPSDKGSLIYLNGDRDLEEILSKVEEAGGKIILFKTAVGPNGSIWLIFQIQKARGSVSIHLLDFSFSILLLMIPRGLAMDFIST